MAKRHNHNLVKLKIDDKTVEVDEEFASLILELNRLGLKTINSCQGGDDGSNPFAYISFQLGDDCIFDYYPDKKVLTLRWNRAHKKFMPVHLNTYNIYNQDFGCNPQD